jgi:5-methylcytosine-specific restriction enzyme subunit McrC
MKGVVVELREWQTKTPEKGNELYNRFLDDEPAKQTAAKLTEKGILEITELKDGLKIAANSYVGKIKIGSIQINVHPKLYGTPLYRLLKYAYGLRDLELFSESLHYIDKFPFYDILIHQLCAECEELIARGLNRRYIRIADELNTPRGRIDIRRLTNRSGITSATLPCTFFKRMEDNLLNRVLLAGMRLGIKLTEDLQLKIKLNRLCALMEDTVATIDLNRDILHRVWRSLDRLSENYRAALEVINILYESQGIQVEDGLMHMQLHGFFFDMNKFFQALLSKLLHEFLDGYDVRDEYTLHDMLAYTPGFNPQRRKAPTPRPDFAVMKENRVILLLDAKYRDLWENPLPREMLYQLAIYAVSGKGNNTSKILYPTMNESAKVQKIDIKSPVTGAKYAQVILQPVLLLNLAELIANEKNNKNECSKYIQNIVFS